MGLNTNLNELLLKLGIDPQSAEVSAFKRSEDDSEYEVWSVTTDKGRFVLKKAKNYEFQVYSCFLRDAESCVPRLYKSAHNDDADYLLMEYVEGADLCKCSREALKEALNSLIYLQKKFWGNETFSDSGYCFDESMKSRMKRGKYLNDAELEEQYCAFLDLYGKTPRTLCHDDLLQFNVLFTGDHAAIIDWEFAGILPYPTSLARLIAHGTDDPNDFFYMSDDDRAFAIEYYYDSLLKEKGIGYDEYRKTLDYFLLYEYCEWIMVGNKYGCVETQRRCREYFEKAKKHVQRLKAFRKKGHNWA